MKIAKSNRTKLQTSQSNTCSSDVIKNKYQSSIDYIKLAIDSLGEIASDDPIAKDAIANLSVVLLDLK